MVNRGRGDWKGCRDCREWECTVIGRSQRLKQNAHLSVSSRMVVSGSFCVLFRAPTAAPTARESARSFTWSNHDVHRSI